MSHNRLCGKRFMRLTAGTAPAPAQPRVFITLQELLKAGAVPAALASCAAAGSRAAAAKAAARMADAPAAARRRQRRSPPLNVRSQSAHGLPFKRPIPAGGGAAVARAADAPVEAQRLQ